MNDTETMLKAQFEVEGKGAVDPLDIPASLRRAPVVAEIIPDVPIEIVRQFVTVEEEGGIPVNKE